jgi:hypothetical protein
VFNKLAAAEPTSLEEEEEEEEEEDLDSRNSVDLESTQLMILQLRSFSVSFSELWIFQGPKIHQIMKNSCKSRIRKLELESASSS